MAVTLGKIHLVYIPENIMFRSSLTRFVNRHHLCTIFKQKPKCTLSTNATSPHHMETGFHVGSITGAVCGFGGSVYMIAKDNSDFQCCEITPVNIFGTIAASTIAGTAMGGLFGALWPFTVTLAGISYVTANYVKDKRQRK